MSKLEISAVDDFKESLKVGKLYILTSSLEQDENKKIIFPESFPNDSKLLGRIYYFSLALWDEVRIDLHTIRRNTDLSLNEPFIVMGIEGDNIYNIIQTTEDGVKMGHIKFLGETKSSNLFVAFLVDGNLNESL